MVCIIPAEHSLPVLRGCSQNPQYSSTTLKAHPSGGMWVQDWSSKATNESRDASEADKHGFLGSCCVSRQSSLRLTWGHQHLSEQFPRGHSLQASRLSAHTLLSQSPWNCLPGVGPFPTCRPPRDRRHVPPLKLRCGGTRGFLAP